MFVFNAKVPAFQGVQRLPLRNGRAMWGGYRQRLMISLIYAISFHCFLRIDEALNIQLHNLQVYDENWGAIKVTLDFRKTAQTRGWFFPIFYLYTSYFSEVRLVLKKIQLELI